MMRGASRPVASPRWRIRRQMFSTSDASGRVEVHLPNRRAGDGTPARKGSAGSPLHHDVASVVSSCRFPRPNLR